MTDFDTLNAALARPQSRALGQTTALAEIVRRMGATLVCHGAHYARQVARQFGIRTAALAGLDALRGGNEGVVLDNGAAHAIVAEAAALRAEAATLRAENDRLRRVEAQLDTQVKAHANDLARVVRAERALSRLEKLERVAEAAREYTQHGGRDGRYHRLLHALRDLDEGGEP